METIHAVIRQDFIPLLLHCESAQAAITRAKELHACTGGRIANLRAVSLAPDSDAPITLWRPAP